MRRGPDAPRAWDNFDLGQTFDGDMRQRVASVGKAFARLQPQRAALRDADLFIARNLDMLILAQMTRKSIRSRVPLIYECLDIHHLMTRTDVVGLAMRNVERRLLQASERVIVSSPGFIREYFDVHHRHHYRASIIENRLPPGSVPDGRPAPGICKDDSEPIVIGWFGNLRCRRSLQLLREMAARLPDRVRVVLYGYPSLFDVPEFPERVQGLSNLQYRGRYHYPDDLAKIYGEIDVIWSGDFHDAKFNSRWLLPNRVYEGGYFGVPPIAPGDSETGRWVESRSAGWLVGDPLESTLYKLLSGLTHAEIYQRRCELLALDRDRFVQPEREMLPFVDQVLKRAVA